MTPNPPVFDTRPTRVLSPAVDRLTRGRKPFVHLVAQAWLTSRFVCCATVPQEDAPSRWRTTRRRRVGDASTS